MQTDMPRSHAHTLRACRAQRVVVTLLSATALAHASFGPHSDVSAFGKGLEGWPIGGNHLVDWTGKPDRMSVKIVAIPLH